MKALGKKLVAFMLTVIMIVGVFSTAVFAESPADSWTEGSPTEVLASWVSSGHGVKYDKGTVKAVDSAFAERTYKVQGGGTLKYKQMFHSTATTGSSGDVTFCYLNEAAFNKLNSDGKRKFLEDFFASANACVYYSDAAKSGSANAVSEDGVIVNIDGNSNRVSAIAFGPKHVLMIVGMNKIVKDAENALSRARNEAAPINAQRFNIDTPCKKTGACFDCLSPQSICCQFLITRRSMHAGRIKVILVNDALGF